jgi:hypothetical protein
MKAGMRLRQQWGEQRMAATTDAIDLAKVFLFDLDGSLADYDGTLLADLERMRSPAEPPVAELRAAFAQPHLRARIDAATARPGWWAGLPPLEAGMAVYRLAKGIGFDCQVLTKMPWFKALLEEVMEQVKESGNGTAATS